MEEGRLWVLGDGGRKDICRGEGQRSVSLPGVAQSGPRPWWQQWGWARCLSFCPAVGRRALWALPGGGSMWLEGGGKGEVGLACLSLGRKRARE